MFLANQLNKKKSISHIMCITGEGMQKFAKYISCKSVMKRVFSLLTHICPVISFPLSYHSNHDVHNTKLFYFFKYWMFQKRRIKIKYVWIHFCICSLSLTTSNQQRKSLNIAKSYLLFSNTNTIYLTEISF